MGEQEVEIEVCCDVLLEAIENGGICVVENSPGVYVEVIPDEKRDTGIQISFCPFCGQIRPNQTAIPVDYSAS